MKKLLVSIVTICLCVGMGFAVDNAVNQQKIYPVDSDVYQAITLLFINQGLALPSTTGPWSADELSGMLEKIDRDDLAEGAKNAYDFAAGQLGEGGRAVRFGLDVALEGYYHTDTVNFTKEEQWIRGFDERSPLMDIVLETWPSEHFYGYTSLSVGNNMYNGFSATEGATSTLFGSSALTTNIIMLPPAVMRDLDFSMPYRAFGAIGGDGWSAQVGRDKLSWGSGVSGNFVIGDHVRYHNVGRITMYGDSFKYTFATSFFPHPSEYYPVIDGSGNFNNPWSQHVVTPSGLNMFMAHRLEWRLFSDKVGIALTEAIMYQSEDNTLDLRVLNPVMIYHNYYLRSNSNSIISLELDYSPISFLNLYGQMAVDEFPLPGEPVPGVAQWALPNGFGYMVGAKGSYPMGNGFFFGSLEWAQTDPYLYLRDAGRANDGTEYQQDFGDYGINWVVAIRQFTDFATVYEEQFLGYQYGGDAVVINANAGYKVFGNWSVEGNVFYMLHGTHDKWTLWHGVGNGDGTNPVDGGTPTDVHESDNNGDLNADLRDAVSRTMVIGLKGGYTILPSLNVYGQLDYINIVNPGNLSTNLPISDVQVTLGVSYSL